MVRDSLRYSIQLDAAPLTDVDRHSAWYRRVHKLGSPLHDDKLKEIVEIAQAALKGRGAPIMSGLFAWVQKELSEKNRAHILGELDRLNRGCLKDVQTKVKTGNDTRKRCASSANFVFQNLGIYPWDLIKVSQAPDLWSKPLLEAVANLAKTPDIDVDRVRYLLNREIRSRARSGASGLSRAEVLIRRDVESVQRYLSKTPEEEVSPTRSDTVETQLEREDGTEEESEDNEESSSDEDEIEHGRGGGRSSARRASPRSRSATTDELQNFTIVIPPSNYNDAEGLEDGDYGEGVGQNENHEDEILQDETAQDETAQDATAQTETAQTETAQTETAQAETAQTETAQEETAQTETAQTETAQDETAQTETAQDETAQTETAQIETAQTETAQDDTPQDEATQDERAEDNTLQDETLQDDTPQDETPQDETSQDELQQDELQQDRIHKSRARNATPQRLSSTPKQQGARSQRRGRRATQPPEPKTPFSNAYEAQKAWQTKSPAASEDREQNSTLPSLRGFSSSLTTCCEDFKKRIEELGSRVTDHEKRIADAYNELTQLKETKEKSGKRLANLDKLVNKVPKKPRINVENEADSDLELDPDVKMMHADYEQAHETFLNNLELKRSEEEQNATNISATMTEKQTQLKTMQNELEDSKQKHEEAKSAKSREEGSFASELAGIVKVARFYGIDIPVERT